MQRPIASRESGCCDAYEEYPCHSERTKATAEPLYALCHQDSISPRSCEWFIEYAESVCAVLCALFRGRAGARRYVLERSREGMETGESETRVPRREFNLPRLANRGAGFSKHTGIHVIHQRYRAFFFDSRSARRLMKLNDVSVSKWKKHDAITINSFQIKNFYAQIDVYKGNFAKPKILMYPAWLKVGVQDSSQIYPSWSTPSGRIFARPKKKPHSTPRSPIIGQWPKSWTTHILLGN
jgi:hypothetical protein